MAEAKLTIASKNYGSWSLRGWLLCKLAGLEFDEQMVGADDPSTRAELLLLSPSFLVPCLTNGPVKVWDTLAIAEYLNELRPAAHMLPRDRAARARCRSIAGEMHSGFSALRASLPMNLRAFRPGFTVWSAAQADIDSIAEIWRECLATWKGPWLFGRHASIADAMYAPVVTRLLTYDVRLDAPCRAYCEHIMAWPDMLEWIAAARQEPEEIEELEVEF